MDKVSSVLQVIVPIFTALILGMIVKQRKTISEAGVDGMQRLVVHYLLPCVLYNSYLSAELTREALTSMGLLPLLFVPCLWSFHMRKSRFPYHNLPLVFTAQESGMVGIPLFLVLFGESQAYHFATLDMIQGLLALPVIAILSGDRGRRPSVWNVITSLFTSPLMLAGLLGLALKLTGLMDLLNGWGIGQVLTETTQFLAGPVSAIMLFVTGYHFSLGTEERKIVLRLGLIRLGFFGTICLAIQGVLSLLPAADPLTRWAVLLYCALPSTFVAPSLGRTDQDRAIASGLSSLLTVVTMFVFCLMAILTA